MTSSSVVQPNAVSSDLAQLTNGQKAAVLVLHLGPARCATILSTLEHEELEALTTEIARLDRVSSDTTRAVIAELEQLLSQNSPTSVHGGLDTAQGLLDQAIGADAAEPIISRVSRSFEDVPFAFLHPLDSRQVASVLDEEHPQTIAVVLVHLPAGMASQVLAALAHGQQADVAQRIARMDVTSPQTIHTVERSLHRRMRSLGVGSQLSQPGGLQSLVDIINRADRLTQRHVLDGITDIEQDLAERLRARMFTFDDILTLDDRSVQLLLRRVNNSELALSLKGTPGVLRAKIMQNLSERAATALGEEMDLLGKVRVAETEQAQTAILRQLRDMETEGQIVLSHGADEMFVA